MNRSQKRKIVHKGITESDLQKIVEHNLDQGRRAGIAMGVDMITQAAIHVLYNASDLGVTHSDAAVLLERIESTVGDMANGKIDMTEMIANNQQYVEAVIPPTK